MLDGFRAQVPDGWTVTHARGADILTLGAGPGGRVLPRRPAAPAGRRSRVDPDAALIAEAVAAARAADSSSRSSATASSWSARAGRPRRSSSSAGRSPCSTRSRRPARRWSSSCIASQAARAAAVGHGTPPRSSGPPTRACAAGPAIAELVLGPDRAVGPPADLVRASTSASCRCSTTRSAASTATRYADLTQRPCRSRSARGCPTPPSSTRTCRCVEPVLGADDTVRAHVTLHNTGDRPALETVQVYVRDTVTSVTWADKELKTYRQVDVAPGERVVGRPRRCPSRTARWSTRAAAGSSSRGRSSCWWARRRATRCCCGRASWSGTDLWASTPPARRTTPSRRTTRASSPGWTPRVRSTARCSPTSPTASTARSRTSAAGQAG